MGVTFLTQRFTWCVAFLSQLLLGVNYSLDSGNFATLCRFILCVIYLSQLSRRLLQAWPGGWAYPGVLGSSGDLSGLRSPFGGIPLHT